MKMTRSSVRLKIDIFLENVTFFEKTLVFVTFIKKRSLEIISRKSETDPVSFFSRIELVVIFLLAVRCLTNIWNV